MLIYKITCLLNWKVYIGFTTNSLKERKRLHFKSAFLENSNQYIHRAFRKFGSQCFVWEIIDTAATTDELKQKEIYWIDQYGSSDCVFGYNMTLGGDGMVGYRWNTAQKKNRTGEKNPFYGKKHSDKTLCKMSESIKLSIQHRKQTGQYESQIVRGKNKPNAKKISKFDLNNNLISHYDTIVDAAKDTKNSDRMSIGKCVNGKQKTHCGFIWKSFV